MGVTDVPQWLPSAFVRSVLAVGATADREAIEETFRRLLTRWQEPDRRFHNLKHLVDVLARVDELAEETHHPDLVRLAAWYHGAVFNATPTKVYARSGGEDERASAELAKTELSALGVPGKITARIADLILNLRRHDADPKDIDSLALCDADLAILATEPQRYRAYRQAVREEYAHLPMRHYVEGRAAIVRKLLDRRHLFLSPLGAQWEDTARENLRAELERLHGELARMGEPLPGDSVVEAEAAMGLLPQNPGADDGGPRLARPDHVGVVHFAPSPVTVDDAAPGTPLSRESPVVPGEAPGERGRARPPAPRSSSLESLPDELGPLGARPRTDDRLADDRRLVAQRSRDRIDLAVRLAKERVERARGERDRLEAARAEREEATAAFRERRHVRTSSTPSPASRRMGPGTGSVVRCRGCRTATNRTRAAGPRRGRRGLRVRSRRDRCRRGRSRRDRSRRGRSRRARSRRARPARRPTPTRPSRRSGCSRCPSTGWSESPSCSSARAARGTRSARSALADPPREQGAHDLSVGSSDAPFAQRASTIGAGCSGST
ncbi:HD domain-containing protein [Georgenia yuyongxinii]